jgi:hypothetical protein
MLAAPTAGDGPPQLFSMTATRPLVPLLSLLLLLSVSACSKSSEDQPTTAAHGHSHAHTHTPPHGGTAVVLGDEAYHVEFVRDPASGSLAAYLLDAHMENFIRTDVPVFEVTATVDGESRSLVFRAVANAATGETIGDTSQFEAQADWLKTKGSFEATLKSLPIRGQAFDNVAFHFPAGNSGH